MSADAHNRGEQRSRVRIDALSDGIFAIALTLLTLNVRFSQSAHETFAHAFRESSSQLLAYGLSFAVIALFWIGHHRFFAALGAVDHGLVLFNFLFLAIVALVPFPTQVLGMHGGEVGSVLLYATVMGAGCCVNAAMWYYARHRGLLAAATPPTLVVHSALRSIVLAVVFAISIPIALVFGSHAAQYSWILAFPARLLLTRRYGSVYDVVW